ncbi:MAG: flagellar hook-associated protein FlgK, partial [Clostridiales bacterium]|nr:flagellar hook-associated protein FlgK [Clostridiales bacterium]
MASTFGIFEAAKSGLNSAMEHMRITGHNIANANTVGYTRQRVVASAKESHADYLLRPIVNDTVGQGVEVLQIQQLRSAYLDNQYRDLNAGYSYSDHATQALTYLEGLFNAELNEGEGLTGAIEGFFSALNTFSSDTTSEENRITVQKTALGLTQSFQLVYDEMRALWHDQNDSVGTVSQEINATAVKLTELNKAIERYERSGQAANDLRDERNLLLDKLSGYVNITYENNSASPSMVDVKIGGIDLVTGGSCAAIELRSDSSHAAEINALTADIAATNGAIMAALAMDPAADTSALLAQLDGYVTALEAYVPVDTAADADGVIQVSYEGAGLVSGANAVDIERAVEDNLSAWTAFHRNTLSLGGSELSASTGGVRGGALYAHMEMISSLDPATPGIPYYMDKLNALARNIAKGINDIHLSGYSYDTDPSEAATTSRDGIYFFHVETDLDGSGAVTAEHYDRVTAGNFSLGGDIIDSIWNIAGSSAQVSSHGGEMASGNGEVANRMFRDLAGGGY